MCQNATLGFSSTIVKKYILQTSKHVKEPRYMHARVLWMIFIKKHKDTFKDVQNRGMNLDMNSRVLCMYNGLYQMLKNEFRE